MAKYFLINRECGLIGGHDYGSEEAATEAIKDSNIPEKDAEAVVLNMNFLNDYYLHPENYINNDKSKIKLGEYKTKR